MEESNSQREIAVYEPKNQVVVHEQPGLVPTVHELQVYQTIAEQAHASKFYQNLGGVPGLVSIMLYARELNIPPMLAVSGGIQNIQGKIEMSARMINSKIRQAGHALKELESDEKICTLWGKRHDTGEEMQVSYTIEKAKKAGLVRQGSGWERHPEDMLWARAISRLGRRLFPDVIGTAYVEGEIQESMDAPAPGPRRKEKPMPQPKASKPQETEIQEAPVVVTAEVVEEQQQVFPEETQEQAAPLAEVDLRTIGSWRMVLAFLEGMKKNEAQIAVAVKKVCEHFNVAEPLDLVNKTGADLLKVVKPKEFLDSLDG